MAGAQQRVPLLHSTYRLLSLHTANLMPPSAAPSAAGKISGPSSLHHKPTLSHPSHPVSQPPRNQQQPAPAIPAAVGGGTTTPPLAGTPKPPRPPKRPVRSRRLQPESLDPEHPAAHTEYHDPLPVSAWEWVLLGHQGAHSPAPHSHDRGSDSTQSQPGLNEVPPSYQSHPCGTDLGGFSRVSTNDSGRSSGGWAWSFSPSAPSGTDALHAQGGFLNSRAQVAELLRPRELPPARVLLGLGLDYADHFFVGPDYRCVLWGVICCRGAALSLHTLSTAQSKMKS